MYRAYLIYQQADYVKNQFFVQRLIDSGLALGIEIELLLAEEVQLIIEDKELHVYKQESKLDQVDVVINRSRLASISYHFQAMGVMVVNSAQLTEICNDKGRTMQMVASQGLAVLRTELHNRRLGELKYSSWDYPIVIKCQTFLDR